MLLDWQSGKIAVGISSCLLGEQVRYDGGHKYDPLINTELARFFAFRPCCPEVAIDLGVPREPIQLVQTELGIQVRGVNNPELDVTRMLEEYGRRIAREFTDICGYIFKAHSPSCGLQGVATCKEQDSHCEPVGTGAFAAALLGNEPDLPVTDENRLRDPQLREEFIENVFDWYRSRHAAPTETP